MKNFLKSIVKLEEGQLRSTIIFLLVAFSFIGTIALLSVIIKLLSLLWNVSLDTPVGIWGFIAAVLIALFIAFLSWRNLAKPVGATPKFRGHTARLVDESNSETARSIEYPGHQIGLRGAHSVKETTASIRTQITDAIDKAEKSRNLADLKQTDELLQRLLEVDSKEEDWVKATHWRIDHLKKQIS
jgi:hypothetical protein